MWYKKFIITEAMGIVTEAIALCSVEIDLYDSTKCREMLKCVMGNTDNYTMSSYASGSTALGFMPTMVGMIGNSTDEILEIHTYHPIMAFFLSICTPSTLPLRVSWSARDEKPEVSNLEKILLSKGTGSYRIRTIPKWQIVIFHILAIAGAGGVIAQSVYLGERAFISFACWTSFWPIVSVMFSTAFVHVADVIWSRLCLGPKDPGERNSLRWSWKIADVSDRLMVTHPSMAKLKNMATAIGTCILYAWLTILFSSIQLVSATKAMRIVLGVYLMCAMSARGIVVWLLEVVPEYPSKEELDCEGGDYGPIGRDLNAKI